MPTRSVITGEAYEIPSLWIRNWLNPDNPQPGPSRQRRSWTNTYIGTDFPSHKEAIRRFQNATTSYTAIFQEWDTSPGTYSESTQMNGSEKYWEDLVSGYNVSPLAFGVADNNVVARVQSEALIKLRSEVRKSMTQASGPMFLLEARQAAQMIKSPAQALVKQILRYTSRLKRDARRKDLNFLADSWLEATYGWTPLIMEIKGLAQALGSMQVEPKQTFQATKSEQVALTPLSQTRTIGKCGRILEFRSGSVDVSCRIKAGASASVVGPFGAARSLGQQSGFAWSEAPLVAYELIPYSFVFGYFSNIEGILSAPYSSAGNFSWISTTTKIVQTSTTTAHAVAIPNATYKLTSQSGGNAKLTAKRTTLTRSGTLPNAEFSFHLPGARASANLVALLAAALPRSNHFIQY